MFPPLGHVSKGGPSGFPPFYLALWPYGPGSPVRGVPFAFRRAPFPELSDLSSGFLFWPCGLVVRGARPGGVPFALLAGTLSRAFGPPFRSGIGDSGGVGSESFSAWVGYSFPYFPCSRGPGSFPRIESRVWWVGAKSGVLTAERNREQAALESKMATELSLDSYCFILALSRT